VPSSNSFPNVPIVLSALGLSIAPPGADGVSGLGSSLNRSHMPVIGTS